MRWLDDIMDSMDMSLSKLWELDGQGNLVCCSLWGHKELNTTEQLNKNNENIHTSNLFNVSKYKIEANFTFYKYRSSIFICVYSRNVKKL